MFCFFIIILFFFMFPPPPVPTKGYASINHLKFFVCLRLTMSCLNVLFLYLLVKEHSLGLVSKSSLFCWFFRILFVLVLFIGLSHILCIRGFFSFILFPSFSKDFSFCHTFQSGISWHWIKV